MSLKNDTNKKGRPKNWSISKRLALSFALASLSLLVVATGYLYLSLVQDISRDDSAFLAHKIQECATLLADHPNSHKALDREVRVEPEASQFIKYYLRVLDGAGQTLTETPGMDQAIPAAGFNPVSPRSLFPPTAKPWRSSSGQSYLLMSAPVGEETFTGAPRIIQAAVDASADEALLREYRAKLLAVLLFGSLFAWAIGLVIARKGLEPLKEIAQTTDRVSVNLLHERIASKEWPDELSSLAKSFDRMLERLESSFTRLAQFSADLAHEIRTPINNLRGETGVALSQTRSADEYRRTLESNLEEYARLSRLVENLLFLARADGALPLSLSIPCSARKLVDKVCEFYEALAEDRQIVVNRQGEAQLQVDATLVEQAISNLLSNALHHTKPGGKINIEICERENNSEISVIDNGCGIPAEHLSKIFDRFYRVDPARSQGVGYGLGLAIVKSIATLHGGSVEVESAPGKGSIFRLRFPRGSSVQATSPDTSHGSRVIIN